MATLIPSPAATRNEIDKTQAFIVGVNRAIYQAFRAPVLAYLRAQLDAPWWKAELARPSATRREFLDLVVEHTPLSAGQVRIKSLEPEFHVGWDAFKDEFRTWRDRVRVLAPSARDEALTFRTRARDWQRRYNRAYGARHGRSVTPMPPKTPLFGEEVIGLGERAIAPLAVAAIIAGLIYLSHSREK